MTKSAICISFWARGRFGVKDDLAAKAEWLGLVDTGLAAFGVGREAATVTRTADDY